MAFPANTTTTTTQPLETDSSQLTSFFQKTTCAWFSEMNMGPGKEDASHSLFAKTTGWVNGPLNEDLGRELRKTTTEQGHYGQLRNTFDFGTKQKLRFTASFQLLSPKSVFCLYKLNLNFKTVPKIGRRRMHQNSRLPGKLGGRVGMSAHLIR